jgi:non-ribosomal peptide synthetase component F
MKEENIITEQVETGFTKDIEFWINLLEKPFDKSVFLYDFIPVKALKYDSYHFQINKDLTNKLFNICSSIDSKLFGLLTSSLIGLLNKYTSNEDIVIAIPIYKQSTEGSYNNTFLPLRINVNANFDYKKLVFQVVNNINEVITHQNFPLKKVSKLISQDDLFSSIDVKILSHDIHDVSNIDSDFQSNFNLLYEKKDECIDCEIRYNASLYKSDTIKRIANHFMHFTEKCIAKSTVPFQEISLLSESEENRLLHEFNNTKSDYPRKENIISLFEEQVNKNSDRIALVFNEKQISYKFLNQRANRLAHYIRNEGIKEGNSVALMIDR